MNRKNIILRSWKKKSSAKTFPNYAQEIKKKKSVESDKLKPTLECIECGTVLNERIHTLNLISDPG